MTNGSVRAGFPGLVVQTIGPSHEEDVEFIVDTGFDGHITLPTALLQRMGSEREGLYPVALADGSVGVRPFFRLLVLWGEEERPVEAIALNGTPLIGIGLLSGCSLQIEMVEGGEVVIEEG